MIKTRTYLQELILLNPTLELQNKTESKKEVSTTAGFVEDTMMRYHPMYPSQLMKRDAMGKIKPIYGDIGTCGVFYCTW